MKSFKLLSFLTLSILLVLNSCSIEKRVHMPGYHIEWHHSKGNVSENKIKTEDRILSEEQQESAFQEDQKIEEQVVLSTKETEKFSSDVENNSSKTTSVIEEIVSVECDNIILKNGEAINAKVIEITDTEIKYKKCSNLNGPTYSVYKSQVSVIKYINGTEETFPASDSTSGGSAPKSKADLTVEGFAIAGFIPSIIGIVFAGLPLGILAIIFSLISFNRIKNNPDKYRGKGLAIAAFIIGALDVIFIMILLYLEF